jgi:hypothetical protein
MGDLGKVKEFKINSCFCYATIHGEKWLWFT